MIFPYHTTSHHATFQQGASQQYACQQGAQRQSMQQQRAHRQSVQQQNMQQQRAHRQSVQQQCVQQQHALQQKISRRDAVKTLGLAAAGVLVGASGLTLAGCNSKTPHGGTPNEAYVSPYDWNGLVKDGDYLAFYEDGQLRSSWGIDVSEHQHGIDWAQVAASGVQFAFIRIGNRGATEGNLSVDEYFLQNAQGAASQGISVSGYFFSQALTEQEAEEEVEFALAQVAEAERLGCKFEAIAYDHERVNVDGARANDISGEQLSLNASAFCDRILMAGYDTLIYGNKRDLLRFDTKTLERYPLWYAEYDAETPGALFDFAIWQYSNAGAISGISTRVDLNLWLH